MSLDIQITTNKWKNLQFIDKNTGNLKLFDTNTHSRKST